MYTNAQVQGLAKLIEALANSADSTGCTDDLTVVSATDLQAVAAAAQELVNVPGELVIGQHDHRHGSTHYGFVVEKGVSFGKDDFTRYLGDQWEPDLEEFANLILIPDTDLIPIGGPSAEVPAEVL